MVKPSKIDEIITRVITIKQRTPAGKQTVQECSNQLIEIYKLVPGINKRKAEDVPMSMRHFAVIRLVAILQSALRAGICTLVDYYEAQGKEMPKMPDIKITLEAIKGFKNAPFTTGEFYAQISPVNSCRQIDETVKLVTKGGLRDVIRTIPTVRIVDSNVDDFIEYLTIIFNIRNALCHEAGATENEVHIEEIEDFYFIVEHFLFGWHFYVLKEMGQNPFLSKGIKKKKPD